MLNDLLSWFLQYSALDKSAGVLWTNSWLYFGSIHPFCRSITEFSGPILNQCNKELADWCHCWIVKLKTNALRIPLSVLSCVCILSPGYRCSWMINQKQLSSFNEKTGCGNFESWSLHLPEQFRYSCRFQLTELLSSRWRRSEYSEDSGASIQEDCSASFSGCL